MAALDSIWRHGASGSSIVERMLAL
jgi:hypothetical protein